jgi:hypothetical protein
VRSSAGPSLGSGVRSAATVALTGHIEIATSGNSVVTEAATPIQNVLRSITDSDSLVCVWLGGAAAVTPAARSVVAGPYEATETTPTTASLFSSTDSRCVILILPSFDRPDDASSSRSLCRIWRVRAWWLPGLTATDASMPFGVRTGTGSAVVRCGCSALRHERPRPRRLVTQRPMATSTGGAPLRRSMPAATICARRQTAQAQSAHWHELGGDNEALPAL